MPPNKSLDYSKIHLKKINLTIPDHPDIDLKRSLHLNVKPNDNNIFQQQYKVAFPRNNELNQKN